MPTNRVERSTRSMVGKIPAARVTEWFYNARDLQSWFDWFRSRGVPCAIVQKPSSKERFSVWRASRNGAKPQKWFDDFTLYAHANGFEEIIGKGGKP